MFHYEMTSDRRDGRLEHPTGSIPFIPQHSTASTLQLIMPAPPWHRGARPPGPYQDDPSLEAATTAQVPQVSTLERPKECVNRHSTPPFSLLCTMMDRLRTEEANKRRDTLARFMSLWRVKVGNDLYPLIRLILPDVSHWGMVDGGEECE